MESIDRAKAIARGEDLPGFTELSNPAQLGELAVVSFIYDAAQGGYKDTKLFDAAPLVLLLGLKTNKKGVRYLAGLNTNYLEAKFDKGILILRLRTGLGISRKLKKEMIHNYTLDRIKSKMYVVKNVQADPIILKSLPTWKQAA